MECPRCTSPLASKKLRDREGAVEQCATCSGIWLDDGELAQLLGVANAGPLATPSSAVVVPAALCPRCRKPLARFPYPRTTTLIERCSECAGVWLDGGELQEIRKARAVSGATCPNCGAARSSAESCSHCGVVYRKADARPRKEVADSPRSAAPPPLHDEIGGVKGTLIRFIDSALSGIWGGIRK